MSSRFVSGFVGVGHAGKRQLVVDAVARRAGTFEPGEDDIAYKRLTRTFCVPGPIAGRPLSAAGVLLGVLQSRNLLKRMASRR